MPIGRQQQHPANKARMYDVLVAAAQSYSAKAHSDRGLPQICNVASSDELKFLPQISLFETSSTSAQLEKFAHDIDNDSKNTSYRILVTEADVDDEIQDRWAKNPELVDWHIKEEGWDSYRRYVKDQLQHLSFELALARMYQGYDPDPTDEHYQLRKEYCRLVASASADMIEEIIDEQFSEKFACEVDDESISQNERTCDLYTDRIEKHRKLHKKSIDELHGRLLLAEKNMRQQAQIGTTTARATRTTTRAKRTSAGHGAATKAGDDGDGDGDGEPPRPHQSSRAPTPPPHHSLTHSLIAGGAR